MPFCTGIEAKAKIFMRELRDRTRLLALPARSKVSSTAICGNGFRLRSSSRPKNSFATIVQPAMQQDAEPAVHASRAGTGVRRRPSVSVWSVPIAATIRAARSAPAPGARHRNSHVSRNPIYARRAAAAGRYRFSGLLLACAVSQVARSESP